MRRSHGRRLSRGVFHNQPLRLARFKLLRVRRDHLEGNAHVSDKLAPARRRRRKNQRFIHARFFLSASISAYAKKWRFIITYSAPRSTAFLKHFEMIS